MLTEAVQKFESKMFDRVKDYEILCQWWQEQGWPNVPLDHLPMNGLMITLGSLPLAAGFIYQSDSPMCTMEWITGNPKVSHEIRGGALDALLEDLCFVARSLGFKKVFTMAKNNRLIERQESHGFLKTDEGMTHLIKEISP